MLVLERRSLVFGITLLVYSLSVSEPVTDTTNSETIPQDYGDYSYEEEYPVYEDNTTLKTNLTDDDPPYLPTPEELIQIVPDSGGIDMNAAEALPLRRDSLSNLNNFRDMLDKIPGKKSVQQIRQEVYQMLFDDEKYIHEHRLNKIPPFRRQPPRPPYRNPYQKHPQDHRVIPNSHSLPTKLFPPPMGPPSHGAPKNINPSEPKTSHSPFERLPSSPKLEGGFRPSDLKLSPSQDISVVYRRVPKYKGKPTSRTTAIPGCDYFTEDLCLKTDEYPGPLILRDMNKDRHLVDVSYAEVKNQDAETLLDGVTATQEESYDFQHYFGIQRNQSGNHVHRDYADETGFLCPSEILYAHPKMARNLDGKWKYVINFNDYTQTVRLERCIKNGHPCSYVAPYFRTQCAQVYNFHRLLSWDEKNGIHIDIFKVPVACSCHVLGYSRDQLLKPLKARENEVYELEEEQVTRKFPTMEEMGFDVRPRRKEPRVPKVPGQAPPHRVPFRRPDSTGAPDQTRFKFVQRLDKNKVNYSYHPIIDFFQPVKRPRPHFSFLRAKDENEPEEKSSELDIEEDDSWLDDPSDMSTVPQVSSSETVTS